MEFIEKRENYLEVIEKHKTIWNFFAEFSFTSQHFKVVTFKKHIKEMVTQVSLQKKNPFPAIKFGKKIVRL